MTKTLSYKISADPNDWSFISGKVAALESELLPRSFFEGILKCQSRADARSALGKSPYRVLFPDDKSLDASSAIIEAKGKEIKAEIFKLCPPHPLKNFFDIGDRFRTFRTLFNQAAKQNNPVVADLDALFPIFAVEPAFADDLAEHRSMLARKNPPQAATPMERSLYLDSAACSLMRIVADYVPEPLVRQFMRDRSLLAAWSGIFRTRWNGVQPDVIRSWFVYENSLDLASSILALESDPKAEISRRLSVRSSAVLESADAARIKSDIDSVAMDVLRDTVLACRMTPIGAERALSYLVAVEVELINLELCLSTIANGINRDVTLSRLRREYA